MEMTLIEYLATSEEFQDSHCLMRETIYGDRPQKVFTRAECPVCNSKKIGREVINHA